MGIQHRRPVGSSVGGQFAPTACAESDVQLTLAPYSNADQSDLSAPAPPDLTRVRVAADLELNPGSRRWLDQAAQGVERLAVRSGGRWTISSIRGDERGIDLTVVEDSTGERFAVDLEAGLVAVTSEQNLAVYRITQMPGVDHVATLDASLGDAARRRRCERASDSVAIGAVLGPGTVLIMSDTGAPQFVNGTQSVRIQPGLDNRGDLTVITECTHPITGQQIVDTYQADIGPDGSLHIRTDVDRATDETKYQLSRWMDTVTGDEGFLWHATHANHIARSWPVGWL